MADVFISYARADQRIAERLASALQNAGYSLWWDADLPAHRSYSEEIEQQLRQAKAVVVLWSKTAAQSQWVRAEADVARNEEKLVQLSIDGTIPPMPFNQVQCANVRGWRGGASHPGLRKVLDSVTELASPNDQAKPEPASPKRSWEHSRLGWVVAATLLLLAAAAILVPRYWNRQAERPVVAVLPFDSLDESDAGLVAGIWEDTRQAISRNPQLLVLGPNTAEEIAKKDGKSAAKLADYLVEASVRSAGDRIRVSANLVRTNDGSEIWNKSFDRQLDDVFQLQQDIAGEIEGHIRGRLAERGGTRPENIATSGEVYALYSDARTKIRKRQSGRYAEALQQLEQVVRMDPNFAPGWATLAVAKKFWPIGERSSTSSEADARRAIALAPNLAAGHAALGFVLSKGPAAESSLRRALEIEPNDIEAMNWLANSFGDTRREEKLALYSRIAELEPLWWPALFNKVNLLFEGKDKAAIDRELARIEANGGKLMVAFARAQVLLRRNDLSGAIRTTLPYFRQASPDERELLAEIVFVPLLQLGLNEVADQIYRPPGEFVPFLRKNDPRALDMIEAQMPAAAFWRFGPLPAVAGRLYLNSGQGARLASRYRAVAGNPKQFMEVVGEERLGMLAPLAALALRVGGDDKQARDLLVFAEHVAPSGGPLLPEDMIRMARIYAVQGRSQEALNLLSKAIQAEWLPTFFEVPSDIAMDPPLNELRKDPRFEQIRRRILAHFAKERAELGTVTLN